MECAKYPGTSGTPASEPGAKGEGMVGVSSGASIRASRFTWRSLDSEFIDMWCKLFVDIFWTERRRACGAIYRTSRTDE